VHHQIDQYQNLSTKKYTAIQEISYGSTQSMDLGANGFSDGVLGFGGGVSYGQGGVELTLMGIFTYQKCKTI
jgi:hypothetical protein